MSVVWPHACNPRQRDGSGKGQGAGAGLGGDKVLPQGCGDATQGQWQAQGREHAPTQVAGQGRAQQGQHAQDDEQDALQDAPGAGLHVEAMLCQQRQTDPGLNSVQPRVLESCSSSFMLSR